jgi:hypothetical protein
MTGNVPNWHTTAHDDLPAAIAELKAALPGWWYSVCECQVSCDATIAPTVESPDIIRAEFGSPFDHGFDVALPQPSTLAQALRHVTREALEAMSPTNPEAA